MKLSGTFTFLGIDTFHSFNKNQDFKSACFLQDLDVQKVFLNDENRHLITDIPKGTVVNVEFDVKTGQNTFISLISVSPVSQSDKQKTA